VDRGHPRHAVSHGVRNFLTRDGIAPAALRAEAWAQLAAYPAVRRRDAEVARLARDGDRWRAELSDGAAVRARFVLLATGVIDEHPEIPGYQERWGDAIFQCPFCHGWEMRDKPLAVLAAGEAAGHMAPLLRGWSADVMLLTNGQPLDAAVREDLDRRGIPVVTAPIAALEGPGASLSHVVLADGTRIAREGLLVYLRQRPVPLVEGLALERTPEGYVVVDMAMRTSAPGVWAAGDLTSRMQQVGVAAGQGAVAGSAMVGALVLG
jgi:thioredoxin reductase